MEGWSTRSCLIRGSGWACGQNIIACMSNETRRHRIRILAGHKVSIESTRYDLGRGRITFRQKDERPTATPSNRRPTYERR